jgi:plasmid stabilization system protein ParE
MTWRGSGNAVRDMLKILDEIEAVAGVVAAERFAHKFRTCLSMIGKRPASGSLRPGLGSGARVVIVRSYVFIYDHDDVSERTVVLRVVHSRRNITARLLRRPGL